MHWRIEGQFRIHIEPLFPSYVFAETDNPDAFFIALKQVPKLAKLLERKETSGVLAHMRNNFFTID